MKALKIIVGILLGLVAIIVIIGLILPKSFTVERSISINAPMSVVKPQVVKFENFIEWEPWGDADPDMQVTIEGDDGTVGAKYFWKGNEDVGSGSQEIVAMDSNRVDIDLHFTEPWETDDKCYYIFEKADQGTNITWGIESSMPFPMNIMGLFMDLEDMIGQQFDKGLTQLKSRCELLAEQKTYRGYKIQEIELPHREYIAVKNTIPMSMIQTFYAENYGSILQALQDYNIEPSGAPSGLYFSWDMENQQIEMAAAIPVPKEVEFDLEGFEKIPVEGKALFLQYYGDFNNMETPHMAMDDYLKEHHMAPGKVVIEEYVTDPTQELDTSKWLTNIYYVL